jgi:hypothetical protein
MTRKKKVPNIPYDWENNTFDPKDLIPPDSTTDYGDLNLAPTGKTVLQEAHDIIYGDREGTYGDPSINLRRIATLWNAHLYNQGIISQENMITITAEDVCWMMMQVKQARQCNTQKRDNVVDAAGYIGLIERL